MRNPFSEGVLESDCMMLPLAEFGPMLLMARFVCVVVEDVFFLGLVELPVSILFAWVLLSWSLGQIITYINLNENAVNAKMCAPCKTFSCIFSLSSVRF